MILEMLSEGQSVSAIIIEYPQLTPEQILSCRQFGDFMAKFEEVALV